MSLSEYLELHPKKHLIFDFDETIFTLLLPWDIYIKQLTEKLLDLDPSLKQYSHGKILNMVENEAVRRWGEQAVQARREYSQYFEHTYYGGVDENYPITHFIEEHYTKYDCYIWTSNMRETVVPILEKRGMLQCFKKIVTKSEVALTKPEPEGFYLIFDPQTQKKENFLMIGDSNNDRGAAANSGIDFYSVKDTLTPW